MTDSATAVASTRTPRLRRTSGTRILGAGNNPGVTPTTPGPAYPADGES
jgi:hypothetical protein